MAGVLGHEDRQGRLQTPAQPLIKQVRVVGDFFDEESAGGVEQGVAAPGDIGCFEPLGGTSAAIRLLRAPWSYGKSTPGPGVRGVGGAVVTGFLRG